MLIEGDSVIWELSTSYLLDVNHHFHTLSASVRILYMLRAIFFNDCLCLLHAYGRAYVYIIYHFVQDSSAQLGTLSMVCAFVATVADRCR